MVSVWIDAIGLETILSYCPYGNFIGCGGTSEFLTYLMRILPLTDTEIVQIFLSDDYYDSGNNEKIYTVNSLQQCILDIELRLSQDSYVRVSFSNDVLFEDTLSVSLSQILFGIINGGSKSLPSLFDHSFVLIEKNGIQRMESYVNHYKPQIISWNTWKQDMYDLFQSPHDTWSKIFNVSCDQKYDINTVNIIVNS